MTDLSTLDYRKQLANKYARKYLLDTSLVCAVIEHESSWYPYAIRIELGFYHKYVEAMKLTDTEEYARSISWGLMQVMGETARELGFVGKSVVELCDPDIGVDFGCRKLRKCVDRHPYDEVAALLEYNGGNDVNYPGIIQGFKPKYY